MSPGPTSIPTNTISLVILTEKPATFNTEEPPTSYTVVTDPPPTVPGTASLEMTPGAGTAKFPRSSTAAAASEGPQEVTTEGTSLPTMNDTLVTIGQPISTEVPVRQQPLSTPASAPETAAPTTKAEVVQTSGTAAATPKSNGDVVMQDETGGEERARQACMRACTGSKRRVTVIITSSRWNNGRTFIFGFFGLSPTGLTSGQAAGIVIGALLAVAIVIAVAIVVARRMGKYS